MEFSKQKLMDNIYALIQESGIKIGELENELGVSTGYISRLNKNPDSTINIELAWKIAKYFGVSVDVLVEGDMTRARDNLRYMGRFLEQLREKTDSNELEWTSIYIEDVNKELCSNEPSDFLLIKEREDGVRTGEEGIKGVPPKACSLTNCGDKKLFSAAAPHDKVALGGTGYKARITSEVELYIFPIAKPIYSSNGVSVSMYYDLYMRKLELDDAWHPDFGEPSEDDYHWSVYPLCNTLNNAAELESEISLLYRAIERHEDDLRIDDRVRSTIDSLMGLM